MYLTKSEIWESFQKAYDQKVNDAIKKEAESLKDKVEKAEDKLSEKSSECHSVASKIYDMKKNPNFLSEALFRIDLYGPEYEKRDYFDSEKFKEYEDAYNKYEEKLNSNSLFKKLSLRNLQKKHDIFQEHLDKTAKNDEYVKELEKLKKEEKKLQKNFKDCKEELCNFVQDTFSEEFNKIAKNIVDNPEVRDVIHDNSFAFDGESYYRNELCDFSLGYIAARFTRGMLKEKLKEAIEEFADSNE